jgi:PAS domain S-box-containing protein
MRSIQEQLSLDGYINIPFSPVGSESEPASGLDERFCEVMDAAPVMIWVSGRDKGCFWFNRPWLAFTGRNMAQEVGRGWADGVHEDDFERCMNVYSSHFDARSEFRMHYRLRRHDGQYRWIDDAGVPRHAEDGTFLGYIGSCIDVHEHRTTQAELRRRLQEIAELNRQAEAAALAASIAHEINQPLAAILSDASVGSILIDGASPDRDRLREVLNSIADEAVRASKIIETIRALYKRGDQARELLDVNGLLRDVLSLMQADLHTHNISTQTMLNGALPRLSADPIQLQQVLLNLIKNAMEAMNAVEKDARVLRLATNLTGDGSILVTVEDTGPGIDAENIERIFDRFFTTKSRGMGMGLSVSHSIVEGLGGRLWADAGAHAKFHISLPLRQS